MPQEFERDPAEESLQLTRQRSVASSRYDFSFIGNNDRSVFPILHQPKHGRPMLKGTGFFALPGGLFLTAKHVFEGNEISCDDAFDLIVDCDGTIDQLPIKEIHLHETLDIAIGLVELPTQASIVPFMHDDPILSEQGAEPLAAPVFAQTLVRVLKPFDQSQVLLTRRYHWEKGYVEEIHSDGLRYVSGRCYLTSILAEGRSSGAPVFNSNGFVIGLVNTGMAPVESCPFSTVTAISEALRIPIDGKTLWEHRKEHPNQPTVRVRRSRSPND